MLCACVCMYVCGVCGGVFLVNTEVFVYMCTNVGVDVCECLSSHLNGYSLHVAYLVLLYCIWCRSHREEASLQCSTPPGGVDTSADIVATVDNWPSTQPPTTSGPRYSFSYRANPQVESVTPLYSFQRYAGHMTSM